MLELPYLGFGPIKLRQLAMQILQELRFVKLVSPATPYTIHQAAQCVHVSATSKASLQAPLMHSLVLLLVPLTCALRQLDCHLLLTRCAVEHGTPHCQPAEPYVHSTVPALCCDAEHCKRLWWLQYAWYRLL